MAIKTSSILPNYFSFQIKKFIKQLTPPVIESFPINKVIKSGGLNFAFSTFN